MGEPSKVPSVEESVEAWEQADLMAHKISGALVEARFEASREAAMALVLIAADDCLEFNSCSEQQFVDVCRTAYRLRRFSRQSQQQ